MRARIRKAMPSETLDDDRSFPLLGILGGGQLGKMMALAAIRMGIGVRFLSPKPDGPMSGLGENIVADWEDDDVLRSFAAGCTAVTVESEWAPGDLVERATRGDIPVFPRSETLHLIRHKGRQKSHLRDAGLPVPDFVLCSTLSEAREAAPDFGYPVVANESVRCRDGSGAASGDIPVCPRSDTLHLIRHKGRQKSHLRDAGLPVPDFVLCSTLSEAREAAHDFGYPVVAKQYLRSYDGYGNATVRSDDELES